MVQHSGHPALQSLLHSTFLWGYMKDRIYAAPVVDRDELKSRIEAAVGTVVEDMLQNTWPEEEYPLDILQVTIWARIEIY